MSNLAPTMMRSLRRSSFATLVPSLLVLGLGCSASSNTDPSIAPDSGKGDTSAAVDTGTGEGGFIVADAQAQDAAPELISTVYANTDDSLYKLDNTTREVTKIGPFTGLSNENMTDIAVDANGTLWGVSQGTGGGTAPGHLFEIALPSGATGDVAATPKRSLPSTRIFFALGITPKGVLETEESLIGGDREGDLWWIPKDGTAPSKLGGFGTVTSGQPGGGTVNGIWQLSGDIVFFANAGMPVGIATVRPCDQDGRNCKQDNDVVIEIDMVALGAKAPASLLRKRFLGQATGFGRLYGVGAWDQEIFAFSRGTSTASASLVSISLTTGNATKLKDFPEIMNGWSGAGVSTSAKISIPK